MPESDPVPAYPCSRLQHRAVFSILLDEFAIAALSDAAKMLREANDPCVSEMEDTIRTHRIAILKQRVMLGAVGIEV